MWRGSHHCPQAQELRWHEEQPAGAAAVGWLHSPQEPLTALSGVRPTGQPAQPALRSCLQLLGQARQLPPEEAPPVVTSCVSPKPCRLPRWGDGPSRGRGCGLQKPGRLPPWAGWAQGPFQSAAAQDPWVEDSPEMGGGTLNTGAPQRRPRGSPEAGWEPGPPGES